MSVWDSIRTEFNNAQSKDIRQKYINRYVKYTNRNFLLYASEFISGQKPGILTMLDKGDKTFFGDALRDLDKEKGIDILIESPGGLGEVAESIAKMIRHSFDSVRFIVPNMAKSAATLLCLCGDAIMMNEQSELGPIDPQMQVRQPNGDIVYSPAAIIINQFKTLLTTCVRSKDAGQILAPYLQMYFPSLLQECENAKDFVKKISQDLLENNMFKELTDKKNLAQNATAILSDFDQFLSHSRSIDIAFASEILKLKIIDIRQDKKLDRLITQIYFTIKETFNRFPKIVKICENHKGKGTTLNLNI
jgi:hypothetical protein